jgi:hypothetical protein
MAVARKTRRRSLRETCVIYESAEDGCWVAHGLRTDQIGTGDCVVDALVDFIRALDQIIKVAGREKNVELYRPAPPEIRAKAKTAKKLPREICEIAHKTLCGKWPSGLDVCVKPPKRGTLKTTVREPVPA